MTPSRPPRRRPRSRVALLALAALALALVAGRRPASAGWDDFEFGQQLINRGHIEYARKVFEGILGDPSRSQADKDRARFGMALLGKAELIAAAGNSKVSYKDIGAKRDAALASIREFAQKNASDPKADDARFEIGKLCLWFVDWANGLATGPKEHLEARGVKAGDLLADAQTAVEAAISTYQALKEGARKENDKKFAEYQWVTAHFFKGLVYDKCSAQAVSAFNDAKVKLDDYITSYDGLLFAVYAQDNLGRTDQELGDCESDAVKKDKFYREALDQFSACANTDDQSPEHRQLIALGFLHAGQLANHAGDPSEATSRRYLQDARKLFQSMAARAPRATSLETGVLALVEWAFIECRLENADQAIAIARQASNLAQQNSFGYARAKADAALTQIVSGGGCGGGGGDVTGGAVDASVFKKIGDDLFRSAKYGEAIGAYQKAISGAGPGPSARLLVEVVLPAWRGIGDSYVKMQPSLWLEAATAYDAIADEVRAGRIKVVNDADTPSRLAFQACDEARKALKGLLATTGDPSIKERLRKFEAWQNVAFKDYGSGGGISDRVYVQARSLFDEAYKEKQATDGKGPNWKKGMDESRPLFEEVSKNAKSEYQDNAWAYRVRVAFEVGDFAAALREADAAGAWWKSPEAEKRLTEENAAPRRKAQTGAARFWKASALRDVSRIDDALALVEDPAKDFAGAADYRSKAFGLKVELLLAKDEMSKAEASLAELQREAPDYFGMPKILLRLASAYEAKYMPLQQKVTEIYVKIAGTPEDRSKGITFHVRAVEREMVELRNQLAGIALMIQRFEILVAQSKNATEVERAKEELLKLRPQYDGARASLKADQEKADRLRAEVATLVEARTALRKEQVAPLRKTCDYFKRLDDWQKDMDAKRAAGERARRKTDSVRVLAERFYTLGTIDPSEVSAWTTARDLYEEYLAFPEVKAAADTEAEKRKSSGILGDVYDHLAEVAVAAKKDDEARDLAGKAMRFLEGILARVPANGPMLVEHLAGNLPAIVYPDPINPSRKWRIPIRRVADVAGFREQISTLSGDRLPKYGKDETQREFEKAVEFLKKDIPQRKDEELKGLLDLLKSAGFDVDFFAEHAIVKPDFYLSLAHSYVRSGTADAAVKAMNVARALVVGRNKVEDESSEWWEAKTIQLEVQVASAERLAKAEGGDSAPAKARAKEADKMVSTTKSLYPLVGGSEPDSQKVTLAAWKALQARLARAMGSVGLVPTPVDLDAAPPRPAEEPGPAPAAPPEKK